MIEIALLGPIILLTGTLLLIGTELASLYRPDIRVVGSIFGIFFIIIGIRMHLNESLFATLPNSAALVVSLITQVLGGLLIYLAIYHGMQRITPKIADRFDTPFTPN